MNCPICGKELPEKARKCGKCGCRPQYLYGRPPMPKWIIPTAIALVVVILAGSLFFVLRPKEEKYAIYMSLAGDHVAVQANYSYDSGENLEKAGFFIESFSSLSGPILISQSVQFFYDENGILTEVKVFANDQSEPYKVGTVEFQEEENAITVRFSGEATIGENRARFQYDDSGRLKEYTYGTVSYSQKVELQYDETGRLNAYLHFHRSSGQEWVENHKQTLTYRPDGSGLSGYVQQWGSIKNDYICESDEWGNVISAGTPGNIDITYEYSRKVVSAQTARQYELQMYLLDAMGLSPYGIVFPVVKTPC
ncbi:MAG: zinc ribbon domain-containing protein [Ruminococcaceae bacterium]|nr:zinc ribbon domain-containing protein [Oscillospiraceae bacterium]